MQDVMDMLLKTHTEDYLPDNDPQTLYLDVESVKSWSNSLSSSSGDGTGRNDGLDGTGCGPAG